MLVTTDSIDTAQRILPQTTGCFAAACPGQQTGVGELTKSLLREGSTYTARVDSELCWQHVIVADEAPSSHYDVLVDASRRRRPLPEGLVCLAESGRGFHGFKDRPWAASPGNVHLSVHLTPGRRIDHFGVGFTVLAAVSVMEAVDAVPALAGRCRLKWVNDVLIDGAKVAGVLAYTQTMGDVVTAAVLGIGLNVETTPRVAPTAFVPRVQSLRDFVPDEESCSQQRVLAELLVRLERNYRHLLDGHYRSLLDRYRERSAVIGRRVALCSDASGPKPEILTRGRASRLGEDLELFLEGLDRPFTTGRLILED